MWQKIISLIQNNHRFILTAHVNPDCDALGSELALAAHLQRLGKQVSIINSDPLYDGYRFLDSENLVEQYTPQKHDPVIEAADVIFVLDSSGAWERTGSIGETLAKQQSAVTVCIDHHPDPTDFVMAAVVDTSAAATAELIYDLLQAMEASLSPFIAQALYAAILTDTGGFRFPKTSPKTHQITAQLLQAGANPLYIHAQIYEKDSLGQVRLRGRALETIQTAAEGQIAYYSLTQETIAKYGVKASELGGFASLGQQVKGVRISIFCTEKEEGKVKISLRSDGTAAINKIAQAHQGGGHPSAAGALVSGQLDQVLAKLVEQAQALLEQNAPA